MVMEAHGFMVLIVAMDFIQNVDKIEDCIVKPIMESSKILEIATNIYGLQVLRYMFLPRDIEIMPDWQYDILFEGDEFSDTKWLLRKEKLLQITLPYLKRFAETYGDSLIDHDESYKLIEEIQEIKKLEPNDNNVNNDVEICNLN